MPLHIIAVDPQTFEIDLLGSGLSSVHAEALCRQLRSDMFRVVLASHYTDHNSTRIKIYTTRAGMDVQAIIAAAAESVCLACNALRLPVVAAQHEQTSPVIAYSDACLVEQDVVL